MQYGGNMDKKQEIAIIVPNKDKYGNFVADYNHKLNDLQEWLIEHFGGFSWYEGIGGYKCNDGKQIIEAHRKFVVICSADWAVHELIKVKCKQLRKQYKQECILYTIREVECEFVYD